MALIAALVVILLLTMKSSAQAPSAADPVRVNAGTPGFPAPTLELGGLSGAAGPSASQLAEQSGISVGEAAIHSLVSGIGGGAAAGAGAAAGGIGLGASLAAGAETAGIGAAAVLAVEGIVNVWKCGTITSVGCDKRADTVVDEMLAEGARKLMYMVETHQIDAATGKQALAQIVSQAKASYRNIQSSWHSPHIEYACGSWLDSTSGNAVNPGLTIPPSSAAAAYLCGQRVQSNEWEYEQAIPAYMDQLELVA